MVYTVVPTVFTTDTWTAANHNLYIKDNFAAVEAQGEGEETVYFPIGYFLAQAGTPPDALEVLDNGTIVHYGVAFDKDADEFMNASIGMPKRYDGASVYVKYRWTAKDATAGDVTFSTAINGLDDGDAHGVDPVADVANVTDTWQANYDEHKTSWVEVTVRGSPADDNITLEMQIGRDVSAGDTLDADAYILGMWLRWTADVEMDD